MLSNIALLATGDEIVAGDILNTNAQNIAQALFSRQMFISEHRVVRDNESQIIDAITSLLAYNDAVIITGGLGPTTDDRTRFALSKAIKRPLQLSEQAWQTIIERFVLRYGYDSIEHIPASNRQQALFPEQAIILDNPNGSAAGCFCLWQNKCIFMLPGPPHECLPMFNDHVLPELQTRQFGQQFYFKKWLLFGVGEGFIAEKLEAALAGLNCQTGYRASANRQVEFKLFAADEKTLQQGIEAVTPILMPYILST